MQRLSYAQCLQKIHEAQELSHNSSSNAVLRLQPEKRELQFTSDNHSWSLRLPWVFPEIQMEQGVLSGGRGYSPVPVPELLERYMERVTEEPPTFVLLLMQAGQAALGVVGGEELLRHKVIRKYMVRKQQGKAQLTHLKTRGKSREGSRLRLANSIRFFEEINQRLTDWPEVEEAEKILYRCPPALWGELFRSKVETAFPRDDKRLFSIPQDIKAPNFEEMQQLLKRALQGEWTQGEGKESYDPLGV